jgi:hypothetical protein
VLPLALAASVEPAELVPSAPRAQQPSAALAELAAPAPTQMGEREEMVGMLSAAMEGMAGTVLMVVVPTGVAPSAEKAAMESV